MNDIAVIEKLEQKLKIKFGQYFEWHSLRTISDSSDQLLRSKIEEKIASSPHEHLKRPLDHSQLYIINERGEVTTLYLNGLDLTELPSEVFELKHLSRLDCVANKLQRIPLELTTLTKLSQLFLFRNEIAYLPSEIAFLERLRKLDVHDNPITNIPVEVFARGHNNSLIAIRNYLNSLNEGTKNLNEVKVILVGDGASGKTSLQKILTGEKFNPHESQTHGINIKHLSLRVNNRRIKYRLWDFGGQEIMHATHQFFLSRRSIYIILLNAREEPNPEYWLNHIKTFGGNSPVIIVINKIDENPSFDVNRLFLKEKYPNIIDFIKISCVKNLGIDEIKANLKKAVLEIQNLNVAWALSWFKVKTRLENMTSHFISYDEFCDICNSNNVFDGSSQTTLVEYLNDLGIILHFKDFSLADTHVLDPEWVTYAVYKILNSKQLANNQGILNLVEIRTILKAKGKDDKFKYPTNQLSYIIELMIKFELCFKLSENQILIPDLLPVQEPQFHTNLDDKITVIVSYSFLPKSIMPRLIVNLHNDILDNLRWRTGMIIQDKNLNTTATIKADYDKKEIRISVFGSKKRDYMSVILFITRRINESFVGLEYKVNIPVDESKNVNVSHAHLLTLESKGIKKYIPDGIDYEVDVQQLLGSLQSSRNTEEELFAVLDKIVTKLDDKSTIAEKVNEIVQLQPNVFGLGINLNALVKKYLKRKV